MLWRLRSFRLMKYFIFLLVLPHLQPDSVDYLWPICELLFNIGRIASALVVICLFIWKRRIPSPPIFVLAAIHGLILFSTCVNGVEIWDAAIGAVSSLVVTCLVDILVDRAAILIRSLMLNLEWLIYGNFISILLYYPDGMYVRREYSGACYFLGYRNGFFQYVLLAILIAVLYAHIEKKKFRSFCLMVAGYLSVLITWSATSIAALTLVAVLLLPSKKQRRWMTFSFIFTASMAANLAVSVFRVMERVPWVGRLIEKVLRKNVSLTGRTYIWDQFYKKFLKHPFLGYGAEPQFKLPFGGHELYGAHNQYFELLTIGGLFTLLLFWVFNFMAGRKLDRCGDVEIRCSFLAVLSGLYVIYIAEAYFMPLECMLMMLAYHADKFAGVPGPTTRRLRFVIKRGDHVTN